MNRSAENAKGESLVQKMFSISLKANITSNHTSNNFCSFIRFFLASTTSGIPTFQANTSYVSKTSLAVLKDQCAQRVLSVRPACCMPKMYLK